MDCIVWFSKNSKYSIFYHQRVPWKGESHNFGQIWEPKISILEISGPQNCLKLKHNQFKRKQFATLTISESAEM